MGPLLQDDLRARYGWRLRLRAADDDHQKDRHKFPCRLLGRFCIPSSMSLSSVAVVVLVAVMLTATPGRAADEGKPFPVDVWDPPFNQQRQHVRREYVPLAHASKMWKVCAAIPHLKDDYWLAVNSALIQESRRLGVRLNIFEAGGYEHVEMQKRQIADCVKSGANGLILGAISADGLNDLIGSYAARGIPVVDLINGVTSRAIAARAAADFYDMGFAAGQFLKQLIDGEGKA